jgi:site-specific recombinase XerD
MLELWYKQKRTLVDFRRGPLGPFFDGFAAQLQAEGYSQKGGMRILSKCCLFNGFLIELGITRVGEISSSLVPAFLQAYHAPALAVGSKYSLTSDAQWAIQRFLKYLIEIKAFTPPKPKPVIKPYTWLLDAYLRHLQKEREDSPRTIHFHRQQLEAFLEAWGPKARRHRLKSVRADTVEALVRNHFRHATAHPESLAGVLRVFFRYCARQEYIQKDFSGLVPSIRRYHYASLPKGMEDAALERLLKAIPKDRPAGARDYAIIMLLMAYGIRGVSVAQLLLDDLDWQHSKIRIRAQKGGKEVSLPLLESVGEALIAYLRHRPKEMPFREVFLSLRPPYRPINGSIVSRVAQDRLKQAGVKTPTSGSRTLRYSWAIRALAQGSSIKAIADVLGHRYINTTFIYAKADLNSLREVALPWPEKD